MIRRALTYAAAFALPMATMLVALGFVWLNPFGMSEPGAAAVYMAVVVTFAFAAGVYSLLLAAAWLVARDRSRDLGEDVVALTARLEGLRARALGLEGELELLAAMREVSRVLNDDVRFERIMEEILRIVEGLVGAVEITIYLIDPRGRMRPEAHRARGATAFADAIDTRSLATSTAVEARRRGLILTSLEDERLRLAVPLVADQETIGVLALVVPLAGDEGARSREAGYYENALREVAKNVSLAIKTSVLHARSFVDPMTGLSNRRHFDQTLAEGVDAARRNSTPLALIMMDLDHFKDTNDTYGHPAGDEVLRQVADIVRKSIRKYDAAFRYGGEELAMLLPETDLEHALALAERIRRRVESRKFRVKGAGALTLTVSAGVAVLGDVVTTPAQLVETADRALYSAKNGGRNRVESAAAT
jgi:diguanylate cyclase (GGDEF)-like protein